MQGRTKIFVWAGLVLALAAGAGAMRMIPVTPEASAKKLFRQYEQYQQAHDPRLADLFDDSAKIQSTLRDGSVNGKTVTVTAQRYKELMRTPGSKRNQPTTTAKYTDVRYIPEAERIRIQATRHFTSRPNPAPMSLLVGKDAAGEWKIFEEISEFTP